MSYSASAQIPTHELISTIAAENTILASFLGLPSGNPGEVRRVNVSMLLDVVDVVKNPKAFWEPLDFPTFPSDWK